MPQHAHFRSRTAALALALLVAIGLAGCGGGSGGGGGGGGTGSGSGQAASDVLGAAATKTAEAGSARMATTMTLELGRETATMTGEGLFDLASGRGTMSMTYGRGFAELEGATFESIFDGTVLYMKFPPGLIPSPRPWVRMDLQAIGAEAGIDLGALTQARQNDPTEFLSYLNGVSGDVQTVGTEEVRGVDTTHYRATIDLRKAADALGPEAATSIESLIDQLGTTNLPAEYWIDEEGRVRRQTMEIDADGAGPQPPATLTNELYDFGAPVDVPLPPANEVVDFAELVRAPR